MAQRLVGARVKRVEDPRLLTGRGAYVDDVSYPHQLHAAFLRSDVPHAVLRGIDVDAARRLPGVVAVFTAADLADHVRPLRQNGPAGLRTPVFHPLASGKVRFVGDPIALVIAQDRYVAEDACDLITVEFEPLPVVVDAAAAQRPEAALLYDDVDRNVAYEDHWRYGDTDTAFARADRIVRRTFRQHRHGNVPMETRGGVAEFSTATGQLTYHCAHHAPHSLRLQLSRLLGQPEHLTTVLCGDVGGAFGGQKSQTTREDLAVCAAARLLGRPVKWIEDRTENLMAGGQSREDTLELELAVTADGVITGMRARLTVDVGAYPNLPMPLSMFPTMVRVMLPNAYRIRDYDFHGVAVFTNKDKYVSYRGPWAVETFARERMLDIVANELGIDRIDIRRRNLLGADDFPTSLCTGPDVLTTTVAETLERARELAGWDDFPARQEAARREGRCIGIGVASFMEAAPGPANFATVNGFDIPSERAHARLEPDGHLVVVTAQAPHGQGHETTLAQVAADELGVPFDRVRVLHGNTMVTPFSPIGTGGSRAATLATGAALGAVRDVRRQALAVAAGLLEAAVDDLEIVDGAVRVRGVPSSALDLADVAAAAYLSPSRLPAGIGPGIDATFDFRVPDGGWAQATHCCIVEVHLDTGKVEILRYLVVEDCGDMINPAIVDGQVRGGVAQGIGGVLYELSAYDDSGQFVASTFMDYLVPTAMEIPTIEIEHLSTPPTHEVNFRGVGEGGAIGAPAALTNAIGDALRSRGAEITELYLPPARVLELAGVIPAERSLTR